MALLSILKRSGAALLGATALVATAAERIVGPEASTPEIAFVRVPEFGSFDELSGVVRHVDHETHRVACYIYVVGSWWTKPNWTRPLTEIAEDGTWSCDVTTGGRDEEASRVAAFLVHADRPPHRAGPTTLELPEELYFEALAHVELTRETEPR